MRETASLNPQVINNDYICPSCNKKYTEGQVQTLPQKTFLEGDAKRVTKFKCTCGYFVQKKMVPLPDTEQVDDPQVREYLEKLSKI